jgi:predicted RND superfamily exporter protein
VERFALPAMGNANSLRELWRGVFVKILERVERGFSDWGCFVHRHRWWVLLAILAITAYLVSWAPALTVDNSTESFLRPNDTARVHYDAMREQFGQDVRMVVVVHTTNVFDLAFLNRLREFHQALEAEVPYLFEVTSLMNVRNTRGEGDRLIVEDLMEEWPESATDIADLAARVRETPLYRNTLVDDAGTVTTLTLKPLIYSTLGEEVDALAGFDGVEVEGSPADAPEFLTGPEKFAFNEGISAVAERFDAPGFEIGVAGGGVMNHHATKKMMRDVKVFMTACVSVVMVLLFVLFRRASAVLLPMLTVLCALLVTYGIMALLGIPTSITGQVLPMLVITVGVCSAVHIHTIVNQQHEAGESKQAAIAGALAHSGLAVTMATVTTAGGLFSFVSAELAQVANLGKMAPIGILLTLVYSLTLLPALLAIVPLKAHPRFGGTALRAGMSAAVARAGDWSARNPWRALGATALVLILFGTGLPRVRFAQNGLEWFPKGDPIRETVEFMNTHLDGGGGMDFVIDTGRENGLHDPEMMKALDRASQYAVSLERDAIWVSKTVSIVDVVKETHKALNENDDAAYVIPDSRELLAQELLLFENSGSDDLEELTDSRFRLAKISMRMPFVDSVHTPPFVARLAEKFREILGDEVEITPTGLGVLFGRTYSIVNPTMARSYAIALAIITPLMVLLIGNFERGFLAMVPNLIPVWMVLGLMGLLDIPLDNSSLMIGSIIIGLAVDDTIHFMHKFQRYYADTGDARLAVRRTLETTGAALLFTSVVLSSGFAVLMLSYMNNTSDFGMLACFGAVTAFLADILVSPALMVLATKRPTRS